MDVLTHAGRFVRFESFEFRAPSKAFHVWILYFVASSDAQKDDWRHLHQYEHVRYDFKTTAVHLGLQEARRRENEQRRREEEERVFHVLYRCNGAGSYSSHTCRSFCSFWKLSISRAFQGLPCLMSTFSTKRSCVLAVFFFSAEVLMFRLGFPQFLHPGALWKYLS